MLDHWAEAHPDRIFLRQPENGRYRDLSWKQVRDQTRQIAAALRHLGLVPGERVAVLAKNCAEWFVADLAIMLGGYVSVPVYPTANAETIGYILEHSEVRAVFIGKLDRPNRQGRAIGKDILRLGLPNTSVPPDHSWGGLLEMAEPLIAAPPDPSATMTIVYTSGSTGRPKGVIHTFASLCWAGETIGEDLAATPEDRTVSYLPLAHITERAYIEVGSFYSGNSVAFVESIDSFVADVQRARPTMFISVPRLWALFRERILRSLGPRKLDLLLAVPRVGDFIRGRIRDGLGLRHARVLGCGSAPISPEIIEWYERVGLNISEGWGMTENAAYGTIQHPFRADKIGSVGRAAIGAKLKFSDNGELLYRSPGLMSGYYKQPAETAEAMTADGFLRTGDLGHVDDDGYLFISGRVKDIFKTAKGLYVSPLPIESDLARVDPIDLVCVVGSGLPQPVALVQLTQAARSEPRERIRASLQTALDEINTAVTHHERLDAIVVAVEPWTVENGALTPTLKIKRHTLERRYFESGVSIRGAVVLWQDEG